MWLAASRVFLLSIERSVLVVWCLLLGSTASLAQVSSVPPITYAVAPEGTVWRGGASPCWGPFGSPDEVYACIEANALKHPSGPQLLVLDAVVETQPGTRVNFSGRVYWALTGELCCGGFSQDAALHTANENSANGESALHSLGRGAAGNLSACPTKNPCNPATGNKFLIERDYVGQGPMPLVLERHYSLLGSNHGAAPAFGNNWRSSYHRAIAVRQFGSTAFVRVYRPDGRLIVFTQNAGVWTGPSDVPFRLEQVPVGGQTEWRLTSPEDDSIETYTNDGKLKTIAGRDGRTLSFTYSDTSTPPTIAPGAGYLIRVTDPVGQQLAFAYDASGRIVRVTDPGGGETLYAYTATNLISTVTYADGRIKTYLYGEPEYTNYGPYNWALTGILDEKGQRYATYKYSYPTGFPPRVTSTEHAGGTQRITLAYTTNTTTVTNPLGGASVYNIQMMLGAKRVTSITGAACPQCGPASRSFDANGFVSAETDWNGFKTTYQRTDGLGRQDLETSRTEGLNGDNSVRPETRTITTSWDTRFRMPTQVDDYAGGTATGNPRRRVTMVYDDRGNVTSRTVQDIAAGSTRTWTYAYTYSATVPGLTEQLVVDGPRTDVTDTTTYVYWTSNATCSATLPGSSSTACRGQLKQVTNALGHVTTIDEYNAHGQPAKIVDANGLITTLTYDQRLRLTARTAGSQSTGYTYDEIGQLTRVTFPDASYLEYVYDNAHRLTEVRDNFGNKTTYTLDLAGNRTLEETRDPAAALRAKRSREYSNLDRLFKDIGGTNPLTQITQYGYDNQGNLTSIDGPLTGTPNDLTTLTYDALNRLKDSTDPLSGITRYTYDPLDQILSVQDPRNNTTTFTTNGLGNQTQEVSPDRGSTNRVFNAGGLVTSSTDARGKVTASTYDALNRLTQNTFQAANPITYAWDQGTGHKGRLTTITFTNGNTAYTYDLHGRVTQKRDTHSTGRVFTVNYAWNATTGRLTSITYPGGKVLTFGYNTAGQVTSLTVGSAIIASGITYFPFGAASAWMWGNSQVVTRAFDLDGRLTGYPLTTTDSRQVIYDDASRITQIKHPTDTSLIQTLGYDKLDRLTSWLDASSNRGYAYDANGNRTTLTIGANNYTYTTPGTTNRLSSTSGPSPARTFTHDAAGNVTADGQFTLTYNNRGRLSRAVKGSTTATYGYDGLGQRVKKTGPTSVVPTGTNYFVYNEQGQLLGEYNSSGAVIQEYVWLGTMPIAVLRGSTGSPQIFYVYADQVDRPWVITNTANQIRWRWDTSPFGELSANGNPAGLGAFAFNQRFPGQYRDAETGLFYNTFRDYDPQTGRYVQSDPIGLAGGINPYLYVDGNPVSLSDPTGELPPLILAAAAGAAVGAVVQFGVTYATSSGPLTSQQIIAALGSGAASGALSALGGPLGGSIAKFGGYAAGGVLGKAGGVMYSALAGATGQAVSNLIDPCHASSITNAALFGGLGQLGGNLTASVLGFGGYVSLAQLQRFGYQNISSLLGRQYGQIYLSSTYVSALVGASSSLGNPLSLP